MAFRIVGTPQPLPVRNPDTGLVEDGFRLIVQDTTTGAKATLQVPQSQFNESTIENLANFYLGQQNAVLAKFGAGATPPAA